MTPPLNNAPIVYLKVPKDYLYELKSQDEELKMKRLLIGCYMDGYIGQDLLFGNNLWWMREGK